MITREDLLLELMHIRAEAEALRQRITKGDMPYGEPNDPDPSDTFILNQLREARKCLAACVEIGLSRS